MVPCEVVRDTRDKEEGAVSRTYNFGTQGCIEAKRVEGLL